MIQMSTGTVQTLERMRLLHAVIEREEDAEEALFAEYRTLLAEAVDEFLPLLKSLAKAGLLTVSIDDPEREYITDKYDSISGTAQVVFENGNIWLAAKRVDGPWVARANHPLNEVETAMWKTLENKLLAIGGERVIVHRSVAGDPQEPHLDIQTLTKETHERE